MREYIILTSLRSRERKDPPVLRFFLQVRVKKPTHCVVL